MMTTWQSVQLYLVEDWRKSWRWFSVQANAIGTALTLIYGSMYQQLKETFPPEWMTALTGAIFIIGIIGRVVYQPKTHD